MALMQCQVGKLLGIKIFKSDNAKSDGDVLTSAKHSAMSPRSPRKFHGSHYKKGKFILRVL